MMANRVIESFIKNDEREIAANLLDSLNGARWTKKMETIKQMYFTKSSRNTWSLQRKLGAASKNLRTTTTISAITVERQIAKLLEHHAIGSILLKWQRNLKNIIFTTPWKNWNSRLGIDPELHSSSCAAKWENSHWRC